MTIYIIVFLASCLCFYAKDRTRGFLAAFLTLIGITIPCLLAAVRDKTIGTDVTGYGMFVYRDTKNVSLLEAFNIRSDNPRGFVALAWLINLANGSFEVYLFIIELLIILPAYFSISYFLKKDTWIGMLFFYFLFYAISLNIMKQMIAVSLSAFALCLALEKHYKSWLLCSVIAFLMHQTGIVSFLIYPMYLLFSKTSAYSLVRRFFIYLASFTCVVFIFAFSDSFLAALSGVKDSYSYMVTNKGKGGLLITPLIYLGFISLLHFMDSKISGIVYNSRQSYSKENSFIEYLCVLGLMLAELQIITLGIGRFGYYFEFFISIFITYRLKEKNILLRIMAILFSVTIIFFQIKFVLDGNCEVYPYTSSILGIK